MSDFEGLFYSRDDVGLLTSFTMILEGHVLPRALDMNSKMNNFVAWVYHSHIHGLHEELWGCDEINLDSAHLQDF